MDEIVVGIPRALLYYKYHVMWQSFLKALRCEVVVSPNTNKEILDVGIAYSIDESCTSAKIFIGHVAWLVDKCDCILIPRHVSYEDGDLTCTKFCALYDIVCSIFPDVFFMDYNIDYCHGQTEWKAYKNLGKKLGGTFWRTKQAYKKAKGDLLLSQKNLECEQNQLLNNDKVKILIVSHPYNVYDEFIGKPIVKYLETLGVSVLYADVANHELMREKSKIISKTLYWRYNKEIIGSVEHYKDLVDGVIFLSAFPCGPDSLVTELLIRKIKHVPMTNIIIDEASGEAGLHTRIESFVDIICAKKEKV